jgi:hypothetical protein
VPDRRQFRRDRLQRGLGVEMIPEPGKSELHCGVRPAAEVVWFRVGLSGFAELAKAAVWPDQ